MHADWRGGEFTTRPLIFDGEALYINCATSAVGGVRVGILDSEFTIDACDEIYGNELGKMVTWKGQGDVSKFVGKPVRLRFELKDADLFSFQFGDG
jgi:hypothetical protein